jgi:lysophospholipase L1-like esterase
MSGSFEAGLGSERQVHSAHPRPRLKRVMQKIALSAATVLFCVFLLEVVLHVAGYGNVEIYEPDPVLYWRLKPNQRCYTKVDHKPVRVNAQGTRGPEFDPLKPTNTLRILSLGDSKTFGWGLTESETYSGRLQQLLQERPGLRRKIEVINAGVNAWSYPQMLAYFRHRALAYNPDLVLIGDANLWTQFSEKNDPEFVKKFLWRVRLKNLLRRSAIYHCLIEVQLKAFYERHRTKFIPVDPKQDTLFKEQQQSDPDAVFRNAIEELCRLALGRGVKPILIYLPALTDLDTGTPTSVLKLKQDISQRLGIPLLDLTPDLKRQAKSFYLEADPVHLNAAGNEIVAQRLFQLVNSQLSL